MDLKNRLSAIGLEDSIILRILPVITPDEARTLYDAPNSVIKKKIPELLERIVNKGEFNNELDLNSIALKPPGGISQTPIANSTPPPLPDLVLSGSPRIAESDFAPSSKLKILLFMFIVFALFLSLLAFSLSSFTSKKDTAATPSAKKPVIKEQIKVPMKTNIEKLAPKLKKVEIKQDTPKPPEFRGAWMFMPWDDYQPSIVCNDGRLKDLGNKYSIQFWIKLTQKFPTKINILEFISENQQREVIFINELGHICYKPGPNYPTLPLLKRLPDNGRHFHIAVTRNETLCKLFVNGKLRREVQIHPIPEQDMKARDFMILLRSKSTLKGLAIDELMISNAILFESDFKPERLLTVSASSVLYIPFEKNENESLSCYGNKYYKEFSLNGGKWLSVLNEVQQIINQIELQETKGRPSTLSVP